MAVASYILPRFKAIDDYGRPMVGAKLYTYQNNTTTPAATYQDAQQSAANTNPIVLDASGEAIIYLLIDQVYTFVLKDANDVSVWTSDDVKAVASAGDLASGEGSSGVGFRQLGSGAVDRTALAKMREEFSVLDFGAVGDGTTLNDDAFIKAEAAAGGPVLVPDGEFRLSTPMVLGYTAAYYGPGVLKFDNAEWWRRGGSSGDVGLQERYTLFYEYEGAQGATPADNGITITYDGATQTLTWDNAYTVFGPGSLSTTAVKINIANGRLRLGPTPEQVRSYNSFANGGSKITPSLPDPLVFPIGMNNAAFGPRAMQNATTTGNNSAFGARALLSLQGPDGNNTAIGFQALYRLISGNGNTAVGSVAGEWLGTGHSNSLFGLAAGGGLTDGVYNVAVGYGAMAEASSHQYTVAIGYRSNGNTGTYSQAASVYVGAFAGDFCIGGNNVMLGYRAGNCLDAAPGAGTSHDNVGIGFFAMRKNIAGASNVVIGVGAAAESVSMTRSTVVGMEAAGSTAALGQFSTLMGYRAGYAITGDNNVGIGSQAILATTTGTGNAALGAGALITNVSGINNTAIGNASGRLLQSGASTVNLNNTTTVGFDARVSGSDQVQLGNGSTTTYVYGTVQNRSDRRDKADIQDTALGLEFINLLRPVDYRWDMREDYIDTEEYTVDVEQEYEEPGTLLDANGRPLMVTKTRMVREVRERVVHRERDGSKKRVRFHHGLISQEVKEVADRLGFDFGGFQDHTVDGGCDVQSLGYDEFIAPLIRAVQQLAATNEALAERVAVLEARP
ncbi:tail fiber domain-containing protein [Achromobacter marplatensis]|uniref:Tail fiber domain-containing protein n=1 Tax=Achromobacter marplatensis TaxID=470868 RepID=A0AA42WBZ6_9BURK|nr:tail fiber domain-containing protein [Achromobacter marplatensis]MDH2052529.1 tail fiber domain-containing protein [Achromobacter marplatensis]